MAFFFPTILYHPATGRSVRTVYTCVVYGANSADRRELFMAFTYAAAAAWCASRG